MTKDLGSNCPLAINSDLWKAVEIFYESWLALNSAESTVLVHYLYNRCCDDPIFVVIICKLHGASPIYPGPYIIGVVMTRSDQTSAGGASLAIAAQCHLVLDASAFRDCRNL